MTVKKHLLRTQGRGTEFGEIALLRNVPRTATVAARTEVDLLALRAGAFLDAVSGLPASRQAADATIEERLGATGA